MRNYRIGELPSIIRYHDSLSLVARFLYAELTSYRIVSPFFNLSLSELSADLNLDKEEIKKGLLELNENGILKKEKDKYYLEELEGDFEQDILDIIEIWNEQNIKKCIKVNNDLRVIFKRRLSEYGKEEIIDSIRRYSIVYHSDYFFSKDWSISAFLKQSNALPLFMEDGDRWTSYVTNEKKDKSKTPEEMLAEMGY